MINWKEFTAIIIASIVISFLVSVSRFSGKSYWELLLYSFIAIFLVIVVNVIGKKIASYYVESEVEVKLWEINRYGFKAHRHFKDPLPAGIIFPIISTALTLGYVTWLTPLVFDVKAKIYRAARRHGLYSFSEMTEWHIGVIAAAGILFNLLFALIIYLIVGSFPAPLGSIFSIFVKLSIFYAFFNMIPLSDLDGNKIFFGSLVLWSFLATIVFIAMVYAIFLP